MKFSPKYFGSNWTIFTGIQFKGLYVIYEYTVSLESENPVSHKILLSPTQVGRLSLYHV